MTSPINTAATALNPTATGQTIFATDTDEYSPYMGLMQWREGSHEDWVSFELFCRTLPKHYGFLVCAGLADALAYLENFQFADDELDFMAAQRHDDGAPLYDTGYIAYLRRLRFTGEVYALPEGTLVGPGIPLLRIRAPRIQATIIEAVLLSILNQATGVATKVARMVIAAGGKPVWDGSLRRLSGPSAGVPVARAAYIGGAAGTATVRAGVQLGIPTTGTMAHAWVQKSGEDDEQGAFETWLRLSPGRAVLLPDTYDVHRGIERGIAASRETGVALKSFRIDSGELAAHGKWARATLDAADMQATKLMASNGLDEYSIAELEADGAPYDSYLAGTELGNPGPLGVVYKLVSQNVEDERLQIVMKKAVGKQTDPGDHQVIAIAPGVQQIALTSEALPHSLTVRAMSLGAILTKQPSLQEIRAYVATQLERLPAAAKDLENPEPIRVLRSADLWELRARLGDDEAHDMLAIAA